MKGKRNSYILAILVLALVVGFLVAPVGIKAQTTTSSADNQAKVTELTNQLNGLLKQLIALLTTQLQQLQAQVAAKLGQAPAATGGTAATSTAATSTAAAVNKLPRINIFSPFDGSTLQTPASTDIMASAADDDGTISKIEFFANSSLIGTATGNTPASWRVNWDNIAVGDYSLTAKATDDKGGATTSPAVKLKVIAKEKRGVSPPTITISVAPANAYVASGTSITITATTDSVGGWITQVVFSRAASTTIDATFQTDVTSPWSGSTTFAAVGSHTISAIATNNLGETVRSASTTVPVAP